MDGVSCGISVTRDSVVSTSAAMEAAFLSPRSGVRLSAVNFGSVHVEA